MEWRSPVRVLSLDGGGVRGIISAMVLAEIEARSNQPISQSFDLLAGTSAGGLTALLLAISGADGLPAWSAQEVVEIFERSETEIFIKSHNLLSHGVMHERYPSALMERFLESYYGESSISQTLCDVMVTAYDLAARELVIIDSMAAKRDPVWDIPVRLAARATTAAPTYFSPVRVEYAGTRVLVDGGVAVNNPAMCAFAEVLKYNQRNVDMFVASIGTGNSKASFHEGEVATWGLVHWVRPILHVVMDGGSEAVDRQLVEILSPSSYIRFQRDLEFASESIDDASRSNLEALTIEAKKLIEAEDRKIDQLCEFIST